MTDTLLKTFGAKISRLTLLPSSGGRYEVTVNSELIYSKKLTGKHPPVELIVEEVAKRLPSSQ